MMRKFIAILLTIAAIFAFAGCGEYRGPNGEGKPEVPGSGGQNPSEEDNSAPFTVKLTLDGDWYIPESEVSAIWNDGISEYTAPFVNGIAQITGLDGEYLVTLSDVPTETGRTFTYDPNSYTVSNSERDAEIELLPITRLRETGRGSDVYSPIEITKTGTYRVTIPREGRKIYYRFKPDQNGQYYIESLVHTAPNEVNPLLDIYTGTFANVRFDHVQDGGGKSSTFTKNFRHVMEIVDDEIGNVFTFAVYVQGENLDYPVTVDFRLERPRDHMRDPSDSYMVMPEEDFKQTPEYAGTFVSAATGRVFLDGGKFKLNPADGYYHLYDKNTETFGEILYAKITAACAVMDTGFNMIEYAGNKALTCGNKNYKLFIEGYDHMREMAAANGDPTQYDEYAGIKGYADYCNSDGVYAVTEELKQFLVDYNVYRQMFYDGLGFAEDAGYTAAEGDQWLFACGYYK